MSKEEALELYKTICENKSFNMVEELLGDLLDDASFVIDAVLISPMILRYVDNNVVVAAAAKYGVDNVYGYASDYGKIALIQFRNNHQHKPSKEAGDRE